ncbi:MAG: 5'/3'-nucleotidase SurE [Desulfobacterales bacterium]|nr:5'/3'-nucleotidase SurE [Desulfobacterales bacterium]MDX2511761.1 5'/3'-nucleotidase SurE [Desulfobacterales bacterium]
MESHDILITNDDGIESPGLKAAVGAVLNIGTVTVIAPSSQQTDTGRGLTGDKQSKLTPIDYSINGTKISAYHCDCSPALIVSHSMRTIFKEKKPDLLISGINYGENLGNDITSSGTIGAALEASSFGIPGIAISKQTDIESHHTYTNQDWSASAFFLNKFSRLFLLEKSQPDLDVLKIDVPDEATLLTEWKITKLSKSGYYFKEIEKSNIYSKIGDGKTTIKIDKENLDPETDIYALAIDKMVSITPLSLDLTSRINLSDLQQLLDK